MIVTNENGLGVGSRPVQLTSGVGRLDQTSGVTNGQGFFSTTLFIPCEVLDGPGTVAAISQGVISNDAPFTVVTSATDDPCA